MLLLNNNLTWTMQVAGAYGLKLIISDCLLNVRDLSDRQMIKIMANENMHIWKTDPNVTRETAREEELTLTWLII